MSNGQDGKRTEGLAASGKHVGNPKIWHLAPRRQISLEAKREREKLGEDAHLSARRRNEEAAKGKDRGFPRDRQKRSTGEDDRA